MMRSKPASSMQKTYDECYLMCSTAVYFESRNNEAEALRSWKSALDTIYHHNAYRMPPNYVPRSETEKALVRSIRDLELQCKERVDLLEALRQSRQESGPSQETYADGGSISAGGQETGSISVNEEIPTVPQWLGDHDVAPLQYTNVNRPPPPPPPTRAAPPRPSSENTSRSALTSPNYAADAAAIPSPQTLPIPSPLPGTPRNVSPERKSMLTTLRSRESKKPPPPTVVSPPTPARPTASKAAGLAWNSISRLTGGQNSSSSQAMAGPSSSSSTYGLRKSMSNDQDSRRESSDFTFLTTEQSKNAANPYAFDMPRSRSAGDQTNSQNLATGAAVAATKLPPDEPLIDLSDPAPSISAPPVPAHSPAPSPSPSPSFSLFSRRPPKETSNKSMPTITKHRSRPDYLEPRPTTRTFLRTSPKGQKTYSSSQPQLTRNSSDDIVRAPGMHLAHSLGPLSRQQSHESSGMVTPPRADECRSGYAVVKSRSESVGDSEVKQGKQPVRPRSNTTPSGAQTPNENRVPQEEIPEETTEEDRRIKAVMKKLPKGVEPLFAQQIINDIVVRGDEVHWDDVAGLETAKKALKEAVVYPFLRPDLFMGLREPARGMLLFGPPGTGKTMLARAVATESHSTFFSVSASSLTSKWHGESEKLVRALFALAKAMAPSIIFVDEIDSLLSSRSAASEGEASRRSKTEFLIQWSDLQRAAAGREQSEGDATRVLVLAATNMPWDIDEAARRRFVRRQYIPLPEPEVRKMQLEKLLSHQKQDLSDEDIEKLVEYTEGFSGSDITALAKDAAMGPLRNLGEDLLHTPMEQIRPICVGDFEASLTSIRPSVSRDGLKEYETWAKEFGERGG